MTVEKVTTILSRVAPGKIVSVCLVLARYFPSIFPSNSYVGIAQYLSKNVGASAGFDWVHGVFSAGLVRESKRTYNRPTRTPPDTNLHHRFQKVILHRTITTLEKAGIRPFVCFGTLLGLVREGGFITNDADIDIGILYDGITCEQVKRVFDEAGFTIKVYETDPWPCRIKVHLPEIDPKTTVDVVFFKSEGDNYLTFIEILGHTLIRRRKPFGLKRAKFHEIPVWIPDPPEVFLDENYGNWHHKTEYHHPVLTSPFTDYGDPMVRTYLAVLLLMATLEGKRSRIHLVKLAKSKYPEDTLWESMIG